ncbi:uncharacterized protein BP5553_03845 [Venustampulla echinocandica]|uniref:BRCT domain-containing protein n=1 Tax=Venustampulla echinocandica TaxID=2656787 RepID=A0A370TVD9_9HELO|nr:uncharacterized protein BP5553_03845 [Venustampulla echinocandica]RDL39505.1 hypothetical protein BP5553_03845 [Venustampulla echinocandica]
MSDDEAPQPRRKIPLNGASDLSAPLAGIIICCTSIPEEDRTKLAGYAEQMGATHRYDLTLDVTHLIVGDYNTPKYRYVAKERPDVKPMTARWIEALRDLWMSDQEIDLVGLEKEHTLPILQSLKISMTGCDHPDERLEIAEHVKANGAVYEGDLTKQITHLISFRTEGAKYKAARAWGIRVVSIEWLRDSLERGMILDEKLYNPVLPAEERGRGAWDKTKPKRTSLGKRLREDAVAGLEGPKRKLRRTASTKLNSQSEQIWGDIVGGRGTVTEVARSGVWDSVDEVGNQAGRTRSEHPPKANARQPLVDIKSVDAGIFSSCRFYFSGFDSKRAEVLCNHLLPQGAEVVNTIDELRSRPQTNSPNHLFVILPHDLPTSEHPSLPESQPPIEKITVWWVERCLHHRKFISPTEHVVGRPFPVFPIEGFSGMTICSSAFSGIDLLHFKKSVELLGAKYSEDMTPKTSVLVTKCLSFLRKDKFEHAQEWRIPIVTGDWLWDCVKSGTALKWRRYQCRSRKRSDSLPNIRGGPLSKDTDSNRLPESITEKNPSRADSLSSEGAAKPPEDSGLDDSTLIPTEKVAVKEEQNTYNLEPPTNGSVSPTQDLAERTEPLADPYHNSSSRTVSTAPAPSGHPHSRPAQEDISSAISDLLAKTKTSVQPTHHEPSDARKRGINRILGRATSNVSTASTNHSRATSVDSTATHGHPVEYPSGVTDERMALLLAGDRSAPGEGDGQPPPTQLQYEDPESNEVTERVMARMLGETVPRKKGNKERAVTIGDFEPKSRITRQGRNGKGWKYTPRIANEGEKLQ